MIFRHRMAFRFWNFPVSPDRLRQSIEAFENYLHIPSLDLLSILPTVYSSPPITINRLSQVAATCRRIGEDNLIEIILRARNAVIPIYDTKMNLHGPRFLSPQW